MRYKPSASNFFLGAFIYITACLLFQFCANPKGIGGGPKDTLAPQTLRKVPAEKATNFKGNTILLEFSEWVKEDNFQRELIITPTPPGEYVVKEQKRIIQLKFNKPFDSATTYTFNFRNGIKDITEGNVAKDTKIVFSTGPKLDSLSVAGAARNLTDGIPIKSAAVWLAPAEDTLMVDKHKPYYLGQTDDKGAFKLENLKPGKYKIFIFTDKNKNSIFNEDSEEIAYLEDSVIVLQADKKIDSLGFSLSRQDTKAPKVTRSRPIRVSNTYAMEFSEGLKELRIESEAKMAYFLSPNGKELRFFNLENRTDSINVTLNGLDSSDNVLKEERKIIFIKDERAKPPEKKGLKISIKNPSIGDGLLNKFELDFIFEKPITQYDLSKVRFYRDTDSTDAIGLEESEIEWNYFDSKMRINKEIKFKEKIRLEVDTLAFTAADGESSLPTKASYNIKDLNKSGVIKVTVKTTVPNFVVQLLDTKKEVVTFAIDQKNITWSYLPAGKYFLRAVIDTDNNGRWTPGNLSKKRQPEKYIIHDKEIPLREGWELKETFEF